MVCWKNGSLYCRATNLPFSFSSSLLSFLFQYVVVLSAAIHNKQPVTLRSSQSSGHKTSKIIFSGKFSNSSVCVGMLILAQHINLLLTPLKKCQIDKILSSEAEAYGSCCEWQSEWQSWHSPLPFFALAYIWYYYNMVINETNLSTCCIQWYLNYNPGL